MRLGDLGAEVIKVEQPNSGDETRRWGPPFLKGESAYYLSINRNKKSLTLDFKSARGRSILKKLIRQSDVLVENFRVGVLKQFGLDYTSIKKINPKIIYCSITGYGQRSGKSHKPSYDLIIQGESGLMDITGFPGHPPTKVGISIADINAGSVALSAILAALYARSQTGKGAYVDISLLDTALSLLTFQSQIALSSSNNVTRKGNLHPTLAPYQTFRVKDGYMNIAVVNDSVWKLFCKALNNKELAMDKRFNTNAGRVQHHSALERILYSLLLKKSRKQWERIFSVADVPVGMIHSVPVALKMEKNMLINVLHPVIGKLPMVTHAFGFPKKPFTHPPLLGEHTNKILRTLGYSRAQIARLRSRNIV